MAIIDLIVALDTIGDGTKLSGVKVYGKLERELAKPVNLHDNVGLLGGSGAFYEYKLFAVDLSAYVDRLKQNGINSDTNIFMVNGSLAVYINKIKYANTTWCACEGTIRYGMKEKYPYLTMFKFIKNNNHWELEQNDLTVFNTNLWDNTTIEYDFARKSFSVGDIVLPAQADILPKFLAEPLVTPNTENPKNVSISVYDSSDNDMAFEDVSEFVPQNREEPLQSNGFEEKLQDTFNRAVAATQAKQKFIEALKYKFEASTNCNKYIRYMFDALLLNLKHRQTSRTQTGGAFLKDYLYTVFPKLSEQDYMGVQTGKFVIDSFDDVVQYLYNGVSLPMTESALKLCFNAFGNPEMLYAFVCAKIFGISTEKTMEVCELCYSNNLSFSMILNENPYILQCMGSLTYSDVETIALSLGISNQSNLAQFKNIAVLDSYISNKDNGSTLFSLDYLSTHFIGLSLTEKQYELCTQQGTYLSEWLLANVDVFIRPVVRENCGVDLQGFRKEGRVYEQRIPRAYIEKAVQDYTAIGLGVLLDDTYLTSIKLLSKEWYVVNYMYKLAQERTGYTDEQIDRYIDEYEDEIGFKLEPEQRKAVHLLKYKAACVAGSAGSGKTTTSNCFTYVLEKLEHNDVVLKYATPTGKAAKRLQEVVKKPVQTMNSMFKTFKDTDGLFDIEDETEEGYGAVYFFDENAMVTIDLLYSCLLKIKNSSIYMFGDFHQLPPIGKGLPFKNLLRILPCQFLTVSKRAAEGSGITLNSNYINEYSDSDNWRNLESSKDFVLAPCNEQRLTDLTVDIVKYYLNDDTALTEEELCKKLDIVEMPYIKDLTPDDIQVVTPLAKSTYTWGANKLNDVLQPIFNKEKSRDKICFYQTTPNSPRQKYVIGDRVIHTSRNMYAMQWYAKCENGKMYKRFGFGINNGEVGKIVGFVRACDCEFFAEVDAEPEDFRYPDNLRDDSTYCEFRDFFLIVKYYDYLSDSDFYILYRCQENLDCDSSEGVVLKGEDFTMLNLFYAGTCHKMQGSQARLILAPLGVVNFAGFITRNMMYTLYTRAIDCVITYGSVDNTPTSMLTRARQVVSEDNVFTVGEYFCRYFDV